MAIAQKAKHQMSESPSSMAYPAPQTKWLKKFLRQPWIYLYVLLTSMDASVMGVYVEFQMRHFPSQHSRAGCVRSSPSPFSTLGGPTL